MPSSKSFLATFALCMWAILTLHLPTINSAATISRVTTDPVNGSTYLTGSVFGGTRLYFQGQGFDAQNYANTVFVGGTECPIDNYYTTPNLLVCEMSPQFYGPSDDLPIQVFVQGTLVPCNNCKVDLRIDRSPVIYSIEPQSIMPGQELNIYGIWRANLKSDIKSIRISGRNCIISEEEIEENNVISYWSNRNITCTVAEDQPIGDQTLSVSSSSGTGYNIPYQESTGFKVGFETSTYNLRVHPMIIYTSSNAGYLNGQILTINGLGFDVENKSDLQIKVGDFDCIIISHSSTKIECELLSISTAEVPTDALFKGGVGSRLMVYQGYSTNFSNYFENPTSTLIKDTLLLSLENRMGMDSFVQVVSGVFQSTTEGTYTFKLSSDDNSALYLSKDPIDYSTPMDFENGFTLLCNKNGANSFRQFHLDESQICTVYLEAFTDYYMMLFHTERWGDDHFTLAVQVPNSDTSLPNVKRRTQRVKINNTPIRQVIVIDIANATGGTFNLIFSQRDPGHGEVIYFKMAENVPFDVSASSMSTFIRNASGNGNTVIRETLDSSGNVTTVPEEIYKYRWTVTFTSYRTRNIVPVIEGSNLVNSSPVVSSVTVDTEQSDAIQGSFKLRFGSEETQEIPYNAGTSTMIDRLTKTISAFTKGVNVYHENSSVDGRTWYITVYDEVGDTVAFQVFDNNLSGGSGSGPVSITVSPNFDPASPDLVYMPVPSEFLRTISTTPQVTVSVNGMLAGCESTDCDYAFIPEENTPEITVMNISDNLVTLTVSFPSATPSRLLQTNSSNERILQENITTSLTADEVSILFGNTSCGNVVVSGNTITCSLPKNSDNTLMIEAGDHLPSVHEKFKGYLKVNGLVSPLSRNLSVSNVSPSSGSEGGGTTITISGTGFAMPGQNYSYVTVTIDGNPCEIVSFDNIQITCITPSKSSNASASLLVKIFENPEDTVPLETTSSFSYDPSKTPMISSLSPSSSSPVLKRDLNISGLNFGTDPDQLQVLLISEDDPSVKYDCNVVSSPPVTNTSLTCRLSGGPSGQYRVHVNRQGYGMTIATGSNNLFEYKVEVTSISPTSGSIEGGTLLTITGQNFSSKKEENQVVIGDSKTNLCLIESATPTQIQCRVQADSLATPDTPQNVYVLARIQEEAVCASTCTFIYSNSKTPTVSAMTPSSPSSGEQVTVTGTGFTVSSTDFTIEIGFETVDTSTITINSPTSLTFDMPPVEYGTFSPKFLLDNLGYASVSSSVTLQSEVEISSVSPSSGSRYGAILEVMGSGFNEDMLFKVDNKTCEFLEFNSDRVLCRLPSQSKLDQDLKMIVSYIDASSQAATAECATCVYNPSSTSPKVKTEVSSSPYNNASFTLSVTGDFLHEDTSNNAYNINDITVKLVSTNEQHGELVYVLGTPTFNGAQVDITFSNVPGGIYSLEYFIENVGFASIVSSLRTISLPLTVANVPSITSSFLGGSLLTINGTGFFDNVNINSTDVKVCGLPCEMESSSFNQIQCRTPQIYTAEVHSQFNALTPSIQREAQVTADGTYNSTRSILDGDKTTYYDGANDDTCFIQLDYGQNFRIHATQIRFFPRLNSNEENLIGAQFEISDDGTSWTSIITVSDSVTENWNTFLPGPNDWTFRFLKFSGGVRDCSLSELEVLGLKYVHFDSFNISSQICDVDVSILDSNVSNNSNIVTYSNSETSTITNIAPQIGSTSGNMTLTINGTNLANDSEVTIDGVPCTPVNFINDTVMTCVTGPRPNFTKSSFEVSSPSKGAAVTQGILYLYADRWSNENTWGGESLPRAGDTVFVPEGQVLLVDVSTPILNAVVVEGVLIFEDSQSLTFDARFIIVRNGQLIAGTPDSPHTNDLTITLHGEVEDSMIPGFGNKSIMVQNGQIDLHGNPRAVTWTKLSASVNAGDTQLTLVDSVDWNVGEKIIIAPTSKDRDEVEERTISSVSVDNRTISFLEPLEFDHFSGEVNQANRGSDAPIILQAEVGLLTRNIVVQGDATTTQTKHGVHIMVRGEEGVARGRFEYIEVTQAGQLFQLGRYPIHYHMIGRVDDSYVRGCSVHHTFNRGTTIHGVHYLTVEKNVYYRTIGHTIFMEDGIETNNIVQDNLVVHVSPSSSLLMSDMDPSGFWQARPTNFVRNNHFVGSAGNGAWFELTAHPTGPSSTSEICSLGDHLVQYEGNVHHSNSLGLRVYPIFIPKENPCGSQSNFNLRDPWSENPAKPARFENNIMYMNNLGTFGKMLGAVQYVNQVMVSNTVNQVVVEPNNAKDSLPRIESSKNIGSSEIATFHDTMTNTAMAMGNKSGFLVKDTTFYNLENSTLMSFCNPCGNEKKRVPGGVRTNMQGVQIVGTINKLFSYRDALVDKDILHIKDDSLMDLLNIPSNMRSSFNNGGWVTPWLPHFNISDCFKQEDTTICNEPCAICNKNINLQKVKVTIVESESSMDSLDLKTYNLSNPGFDTNMTDPSADDLFGINPFRNVLIHENWKGWLLVLATGHQYNFHFGEGVEWEKISFENDYYWGLDGPEQPTYLRHNHTEDREIYDTFFSGLDELDGVAVESQLPPVSFTASGDPSSIFTTSHAFGDFFYDSTGEMITWKLDGVRRGVFRGEAVYCRLTCPTDPDDDNVIEEFPRYWSNPDSWTNLGRVPLEDELMVEIEPTWNMVLDVTSNKVRHIKVYGRLSFDFNEDGLELHSHMIEVMKGGELLIGTETRPYTNKAKIVLHGQKDDPSIFVSPDIAPINKSILNKGKFHVYASPPAKTWVRLGDKITANTRSMTVAETNTGWQIGDELIVGSSTTQYDQMEKVTISSINDSTGQITIDEVFGNFHYGSSSALTTSIGDIDMRAEVGVLTRNVVIESDFTDSWGCSIATPNYMTLEATPKEIQGSLMLKGVEIKNCGQRDSGRAALEFKFLKESVGTQLVEDSSINNGQGWGVSMVGSSGVTFQQNVMYNSRKYAMYLQASTKIIIENNLIMGVKIRENVQNEEFWDTKIGIFYNDTKALKEGEVFIRHNSVSSVPDIGLGYVLPGYDCNDDDSVPVNLNFFNNTAHSCDGGWFASKMDNQLCNKFAYFKGYKNNINGFTNRVDISETKVENMILLDNRHGITINGAPGTRSEYPTNHFSDSVLMAQSLDDCPECYSGSTECESSGFYSAVFNGDAYQFYFEETRMPFHNSTSAKFAYGGKQFIDNVHFKNYIIDEDCSQNSVAIKMNNFYQDKTNAVYMSNLTLENTDKETTFFFADHKRHLDSTVYCGKRDCTGNYNTIFFDLDGSILGTPAHFFGNNTGAGRDPDCQFNVAWNGHQCDPQFGQLLMKRPFDDRGLVIFPLNVKVDDYSVDIPDTSKFNHSSDSDLELTSLVKLSSTNILDFSQTMPNNVEYEMYTAQPNDWTIIKAQAENPATMDVYVSGDIRKPEIIPPGETMDLSTVQDECGANFYEVATRTIYFVLKGDPNCKVKISFANAIELSLRLNIDPAQFFAESQATTFIDRLAALLQISADRIKIVEVREGSTILVFHIESDKPVEEEVNQEQQVFENLNQLYTTLKDEIGKNANILEIEVLDGVPEPTSLVYPTTVQDDGDDGDDGDGGDGGDDDDKDTFWTSRNILIIGIVVSGVILIVGIIICCCCCCCRRNNQGVPKQNVNRNSQSSLMYSQGLTTQSILQTPQYVTQNKPLSLVHNMPIIQQNQPQTKIIRRVVSMPQNQVIQVPQTQLIQAPTTQVLQVPQTQIVQAPTTQVLQVPQTQLVQAPTTQIVQAPQTQLVQVPQTQVLQTAQTQLVQVPQTQVLEVAQNEVVQVPQTIIRRV